MSKSLKNKLSFIVYEHKKAPKYFEIKKSIIRLFFIGFPAISTLFLLAGIIVIVQTYVFSEKQESAEIRELREQLVTLKETAETAQKESKELYDKIQKGSSEISNSQLLFSIPMAQQDLTKTEQKFFELDSFKIAEKNGKASIHFNLVNITKNSTKISGFFSIKLKTPKGIFFYPDSMLNKQEEFLSFADGESFTTSRFRPVEANFEIDKKTLSSNSSLTVYVYSRGGDLIYINHIPLTEAN